MRKLLLPMVTVAAVAIVVPLATLAATTQAKPSTNKSCSYFVTTPKRYIGSNSSVVAGTAFDDCYLSNYSGALFYYNETYKRWVTEVNFGPVSTGQQTSVTMTKTCRFTDRLRYWKTHEKVVFGSNGSVKYKEAQKRLYCGE